MLESERHIVSTEHIRENSRRILDESHEILTLDYNSIDRSLMPNLVAFQKEAIYTAPSEDIRFDRELGTVLFFDVVNFCFKDPVSKTEYAYEAHGKRIKRSSGLQTAMKESDVNWNNLISVAALSPEKWVKIAQLTPANTLYLGEERGIRIRGFAKQLVDSGFKTASNFIASTKLETANMLNTLSESGYFNDEFLKRAQLTVRMLDDAFKSRKLPGFRNTEILTAMADYRIPQVFYNGKEPAVKLSPNLLQKLRHEEPIKSDSSEERALRATVIVISEYIAKKMGITEGTVDLLLWTLSQKMANENRLPIPHMLVATDKY